MRLTLQRSVIFARSLKCPCRNYFKETEPTTDTFFKWKTKKQSKTRRCLALLSETEDQWGCSWWGCESGLWWLLITSETLCTVRQIWASRRKRRQTHIPGPFPCPSHLEESVQWSPWKLDISRPEAVGGSGLAQCGRGTELWRVPCLWLRDFAMAL